jgi:hypothetical protein
MKRRDVLKTMAIAGMAAGAAGTAGTAAQAQTTAQTFVLVHGAWHGGWCWSRVADRLRSASHRVFTPTQTGLGERKHLLSKDITLDTFTTDIVNVIETEELSDIILVGSISRGRSATTCRAPTSPAPTRPMRRCRLRATGSRHSRDGAGPKSRLATTPW